MNCGDVIWASDGTESHPSKFKGQYIYESGPRVFHPDATPLEDKQAALVLEICRKITWKTEHFAEILAGFLAISPFGSALGWSPHIWINGPAGSGKSTIMDHIVTALVGDSGIVRAGGTSEAGMRKLLSNSGRVFVMDEFEAENQQQKNELSKILSVVRKSSSGATIDNAYDSFSLNGCFCFASIVSRVDTVADAGRITQLDLLPDKSPDSQDRFASLMDMIHETLTPEYVRALQSRTMRNLPTLLENIDAFVFAATGVFGNKRAGDQMGTILAGTHSLTSTEKVTVEYARDWIMARDWDFHTDNYIESDAEKLITYIMTARIRYDFEGMSRESTVGELVEKAASRSDPHKDTSDKALRPYGLRVKDGMLCIANKAPQLNKLLSDTVYTPWAKTLLNHPSASNLDNRAMHFMAGLTSKAVGIPVSVAVGGDAPDDVAYEEEIPFE